ncbi:glycosyltransferase family 9 protein [Mucilaginibacter sp. RS28]|uniref:Glycosyltransferase family 9 protein n=1 Tax=Mucilaginibacter straminoryzae TaxID=2932774 RepID=A0A9X2BBK8_9SPHI|nr:glycosyltransferase family 9 protein [Mucilaginibacter straminoryzae]MCJ8209957.1 glycosyltransferase family 9 protein [Mucilaginibacter straminoryzae]
MKILVIRFSSMGDIIYTTPVVRCLKTQLPNAEIHFLTKPAFRYIYEGNPYVDKLLLLRESLGVTIKEIKSERYDYVIDLHSNLRTAIIKFRTGIKSSTYNKQRIRKWLSLKFNLKLIPPIHLVDRYLKTVEFLNVYNDGGPINYYIKKNYQLTDLLPASHQSGYIAFIIGANHFTKRMPNEKVISICREIKQPIVLLGGQDVKENARVIATALGNQVHDACGTISLDESVFLVSQAQRVIGFDTGLTHIAEAFDMPIASIWGSTVPELVGVQPYHVKDALVVGVDLPCRPCSRYGLPQCPLKHFKCMNDIPEDILVNFTKEA